MNVHLSPLKALFLCDNRKFQNVFASVGWFSVSDLKYSLSNSKLAPYLEKYTSAICWIFLVTH